jgi:hypothetical protein
MDFEKDFSRQRGIQNQKVKTEANQNDIEMTWQHSTQKTENLSAHSERTNLIFTLQKPSNS